MEIINNLISELSLTAGCLDMANNKYLFSSNDNSTKTKKRY